MTDIKNNTGDYNTGDYNTGDCNTGDYNTGDCNTGDCNTGDYNTGDCNTGDCNTGYRNTGDCNTGDYNTGYRNTGDCNTGNYNTGYRNTGDYNTGDCNTGYRNTGDCNTGNYNTGYFNTNSPKVRLFNKDSNLEFNCNELINFNQIIYNNIKPVCTWIHEDSMTDEEKEDNPTYKTTGGYLKVRDYKYCWQKGWKEMAKEDKQAIKDLPNFDSNIFKEITGVDINEEAEEKKAKITLELTSNQLEKLNKLLSIEKN